MRYAGEPLSTKAERSAALALLLAAALLLCHGAFGAHHQAHQTATGPPHQHAPGHASHEGHGGASGLGTWGHAEGHGGGCSSCVAYSAVMLVVSLGALLALLQGVRPSTSIAAPTPAPLGFVTPVLHPARGPTLPILQMFRL
jgi:hypothetical protein